MEFSKDLTKAPAAKDGEKAPEASALPLPGAQFNLHPDESFRRIIILSGSTVEGFQKNPHMRITPSLLGHIRSDLAERPTVEQTNQEKLFSSQRDALSDIVAFAPKCKINYNPVFELAENIPYAKDHIQTSNRALKRYVQLIKECRRYDIKQPGEYHNAVSNCIDANLIVKREFQDRQRGIIDKVTQHHFAEEVAIFDSSNYIDARNMHRGKRLFVHSEIQFSGLNAEKICQEKIHHIIGHPVYGFVISVRPSGNCLVYSGNDSINKSLETFYAQNGQSGSSEWLKKLLLHLENDKSVAIYYEAEPIAFFRHTALAAFAERLLNHDKPIYIKSARSSGGDRIVKIGRDENGEVYFETNSIDALWKIRTMMHTFDKDIKRTDKKEHLVKHLIDRTKPNLTNLLVGILSKMENPIVEEEIPRVKRGKDIVEFRLICQADDVFNDSNPTVRGHYSKVSELTVSANVALGGHGERTLDVLRDLYALNLSSENRHQIEEKAQATLDKLIEMTNAFAKKWSATAFKEIGHISPQFYDFAIDVIPKWDVKSQSIQFTFLEIQCPYGHSGLKQCDPETAAKILDQKMMLDKRQDKIMNLYRYVMSSERS